MGNFLSKGLKKLSGNIKRHGGKILGAGLGIAGLMSGAGLLSGVGGGIGKFIGGLGGGGGGAMGPIGNWMANQQETGGWYPGKFLSGLGSGGGGEGGGSNFSLGGPQGLLGLGLNMGGQLLKPQMSASQLNTGLLPMQNMYDQFSDMRMQYQDPNSDLNRGIRDSVRAEHLGGMRNLIESKNKRAVGVTNYGADTLTNTDVGGAISTALGNIANTRGNQFDKGTQLMNPQANMARGISQGLGTNMMYANQQQQQPYDYMSATGMGLLNRALYNPRQYPGIEIG